MREGDAGRAEGGHAHDRGAVPAQDRQLQGAVTTYQQLVKANPSNRGYLENLAGAQYKSGDKTAYLQTTEKLVRLDPSPTRWRTLLLNLKGEKMPREAKLALFELMKQTNNLDRADEYQEYAKLAIVANQPGVAKSSLEAARGRERDSRERCDDRDADPRRERSHRPGASGPRPAAGDPGGTAPGGQRALRRWNYQAAVAAYSRAGAAPATKLQLGIAQLRAGSAGAARTTFRSIAEDTPIGDVASLWALTPRRRPKSTVLRGD